jgi:short-subunit dehydrogenase
VLVAPTDVSDPEAVDRLARQAVQAFGRIDVWINSAAVAAFGPVSDIPPHIFRRVLDVDVMGYVYGARSALAVMRQQGSGTLINFSSVVAAAAVPLNAPYVVAKAAVRAFGGSLRQELWLDGHHDVHVCTVLPATMDTPFFANAANYSGRKVIPMAPVYTPERAARKAVALVRRPRREAFVGPAGPFLAVLAAVLPELTEKVLARQMNRAHLSRFESAAADEGNVVHPSPHASVHGGWSGGRRTALRRFVAAALLVGAGYGAVGRRRSRQKSARRRIGDVVVLGAGLGGRRPGNGRARST